MADFACLSICSLVFNVTKMYDVPTAEQMNKVWSQRTWIIMKPLAIGCSWKILIRISGILRKMPDCNKLLTRGSASTHVHCAASMPMTYRSYLYVTYVKAATDYIWHGVIYLFICYGT